MTTRISEQNPEMSFLDGSQFRVWPEVLSCPAESSSLNTLKRTSSSLNLKMPFARRTSLSRDSLRNDSSRGPSKAENDVAIRDLFSREDSNAYFSSSEDDSARYLRADRPKSSRNATQSKKDVDECKDTLPEPVKSATSNLEYRYSKTGGTKRKKLSKTKSGASVNSNKDKSLGKARKKCNTSTNKTNNENIQLNGTLTKHKSTGRVPRSKKPNKNDNFDLTCAEPHVTNPVHLDTQLSNSGSLTDPYNRITELDHALPSKLSLTESERDIFRTAMCSMKKNIRKEKAVARVPAANNKTTANGTIKKDLSLEIKSLNMKLVSSDNMNPVTIKSKISATIKSNPMHKNEIPKLNLVKSARDLNTDHKSKFGQTVSKVKTGQQPGKKILNKTDFKSASHATINKKSDAGLLKKAAPRVASIQMVSQNLNKKSVAKV